MSENLKRRERGNGSIFKYANSPNWYIKYYSGGKPQVESTRGARRKDATDLLKRRIRLVDDGIPVTPTRLASCG